MENKKELYHSGVKGMHWGVWNSETAARYAGRAGNAAKTVGGAGKTIIKKTASGTKKAAHKIVRVAKDSAAKKKAKKEAEAKAEKQREEKRQNIRKSRQFKSVTKMTDKELDAAISRLDKEKRYKQLLEETTIVGKGKKLARNALEKSAEKTATDLLNYAGGKVVKGIKIKTEEQLSKSNDDLLKSLADDRLLKDLLKDNKDETKDKKKQKEAKHSDISDDELYHHGVMGMKWGIRRYQSYDTVPRGSGKGGKEVGTAKKQKIKL